LLCVALFKSMNNKISTLLHVKVAVDASQYNKGSNDRLGAVGCQADYRIPEARVMEPTRWEVRS